MRRSLKIILIIVPVLVGVAFLLPMIVPPRPGQNAEDHLSPERRKFMTPEEIVRIINPRPGSTVVDIGAGYGLFTVPLARAVGSSGKVFATDVDRRVISYLSKTSRDSGMTTINPVKVRADGVDPFYKQQSFDLMLLADIIELLDAPEAFLNELRPSLKEGTGRIWVVQLRHDPDFSEIEFTAPAIQRDLLQGSAPQSPIVRRLSARTRDALRADPAAGGGDAFLALLIADLNRILEDPTFWPEIQSLNLPLNADEQNIRKTLSQKLSEKGYFTPGAVISDGAAMPALRLLNRLVLQEMLRLDYWGKTLKLSKMTPDKSLPAPLLAMLVNKPDYALLFRNAGYEQVQHRVMTYSRVWEFRRTR
jgi:ubiquinone/menaquinone biosynthesis C-methylase UbiE